MLLKRIIHSLFVLSCLPISSHSVLAHEKNIVDEASREQVSHSASKVEKNTVVTFSFYGDEERQLQALLNLGTYCREDIQPSGATLIQCGPYTPELWKIAEPLVYEITDNNYQVTETLIDALPNLGLQDNSSDEVSPYLNTFTSELVAISQQQYEMGNTKAYQEQLPSRLVANGVSTTEQWLSEQWEDANFDIGLSLNKGNQWAFDHFETLLPFWDQNGRALWFMQTGAVFNRENFHGRDFAHLGLGYRQLDDSQFFGVNGFFDYDLSRQHTRVSVGAEYGLDYGTFSTNAYFPLSNWKDSPDHYEGMNSLVEKAAKGWDLNLETYLPLDTRWKFGLTAGQYLGRYVEHSDGSLPSKNPYYFSLSTEFRPDPAWAFSLGYQTEQGAKEQWIAGINYTLSLSGLYEGERRLSQQSLLPKPERLTDFVQRDHNMVLEYKQKFAEISIRLPESALVTELSQQMLSSWMEVKGGADIVSYQWQGDAANYLNDIQASSPTFIAPAYRYDANNTLSLSVSYKLRSGQIKQSNTMKITVTDSKVLESLDFSPARAVAGERITATAKLSVAAASAPIAFELSAESLLGLNINGEVPILKDGQTTIIVNTTTDEEGVAELVLLSEEANKVKITAIYHDDRDHAKQGIVEWAKAKQYQIKIFRGQQEIIGSGNESSDPLFTHHTLTAELFEDGESINDTSNFVFQWWRRAHDKSGDFEKIAGASGKNYQLTGADQGFQIKVTANQKTTTNQQKIIK
ncbi:TPA: inverse autotransporter beta domain-containing protein [Vibrio campbellii]